MAQLCRSSTRRRSRPLAEAPGGGRFVGQQAGRRAIGEHGGVVAHLTVDTGPDIDPVGSPANVVTRALPWSEGFQRA